MNFYISYIFIFLGFWAKAQDPKNFNGYIISGLAQGTTYQIKYFSPTFIVQKQEIDSVFATLDQSLSIYKSNSIISLFNNSETTVIEMDKHLKKVAKESLKTYKLTNGYFDITVMPLINLWGFGPKGFKNNPNTNQIDSVMKFVGTDKLKIKKNKLIKRRKGVSIDVNGIAQGYSVDIIGEYLEQNGIHNYIVEIGGEIKTKGKKPTGDFLVEIQRPYADSSQNNYKLIANNIAITTSGNYEKRRDYNGQYISHHINPQTGYPILNNVISVTVLAKTAMQADALDNYFMSLPPEKSIAKANKMKDIALYLIYQENNILKELKTSNFNNYIYK